MASSLPEGGRAGRRRRCRRAEARTPPADRRRRVREAWGRTPPSGAASIVRAPATRAAYLVGGQGPLPAGVGVDHDQGRDEPRMAAVELEHHRATPGQACEVRGPEIKRLEQRGKRIRETRQAEALRQVGRPARPRLVPRDDGELVGQTGKLRLPDAAVLGRAVDQDQRRPLTDPLVGDPEPAHLDRLHLRNVLVPGVEARSPAGHDAAGAVGVRRLRLVRSGRTVGQTWAELRRCDICQMSRAMTAPMIEPMMPAG